MSKQIPVLKAPPRNEFLGALADNLPRVAAVADEILPGAPAEFLLGDLAKYIDNASYGDARLWRGGLTGAPAPGALDAIGLVPGAKVAAIGKTAAKAPVLAERVIANAKRGESVLSGSRKAQRGILQLGGDPELTSAHGTSLWKLIAAKEAQGRLALAKPSFAIQKGGLANNFADGVYLIPKPNHLDPAMEPSTLFNRDFYSDRGSSNFHLKDTKLLAKWLTEFGNKNAAFRQELRRRLQERMPSLQDRKSVTLQEAGSGPNAQHKAALQASPHFSSYTQYEQSPKGARLLLPLGNLQRESSDIPWISAVGDAEEAAVQTKWEPVWKLLEKQAAEKGGVDPGKEFMRRQFDLLHPPTRVKWQSAQKQGLLSPDYEELLKTYGKAVRSMPTSYAELQRHGLLPVDSRTFAGAIHTTPSGEGFVQLQDLLKEVGLPVTQAPMDVTPAELKALADQLQADSVPTVFRHR